MGPAEPSPFQRQWSKAPTWDWGEEGSDWDEEAERRNSHLHQPSSRENGDHQYHQHHHGKNTANGNNSNDHSTLRSHQDRDNGGSTGNQHQNRNQSDRCCLAHKWRKRVLQCASRRLLCGKNTLINFRASPRMGGGSGVVGGGRVGGVGGGGVGGGGMGGESSWSGTKEVRDFLVWMAFIVAHMAQVPLLWFCFWQYVCPRVGNPGYDQHHVGKAVLPLWLLWVFGVLHLRRQLLERAQPPIAWVVRNGEIFICVSIMMTICANFCTMVHRPRPPLFDVGFSLIPAQGRHSAWRPLSDILTLALPGVAFFRSLLLDRRMRCRFVADWLRLMSVTYLMRCLCVTLTSLPGPAPHCESYAAYSPPLGWHDVATRLGPLMGDFRTCGDQVFSGHIAWTTMTMLLLAKSFRRAPLSAYRFVKLSGILYLLTMCTCTIAGRKHYTVDVALAVVIAGLTFFLFQEGMTPMRHPATGDIASNLLPGEHENNPNHGDSKGLDFPLMPPGSEIS